ncbi:MAG: flippase-like domain-containing protein [Chitinispirillales bacterium]|jgi:uncharacterized protein (TIRG00374 family)|nr:flippase-like domain-containing protein [Chitinispirillales bacterium]
MEQTKKKSPVKKILLRLLRVILVAAPLVWVYTRTDGAALKEAIAAVHIQSLFYIAALYFLGIMTQGAKWWILVRRFIPELKLSKAVFVHMESTFYAMALPTAAAQDVVKSVILSRNHNPQIVWAASWLGKLMGCFVLIMFSVFGVIYLQSDLLPAGFGESLFTTLALMTVLIAASFSKKVTRLFKPLKPAAASLLGPKIVTFAEKMRNGIYAFKHERITLLQTFLFSTVSMLLIMFTISFTIYTVTGQFYFIECLAFVPLIEIMALSLPLTPGGLGIREALMAALFVHLGLSAEQTATYVTISLLMSMIRLTGGIMPLYRLAVRRKIA